MVAGRRSLLALFAASRQATSAASRATPVTWRKVLVPTDGSEATLKAISQAVHNAKLAGASVVAVAVKDPYPVYVDINDMSGTMNPSLPQEFDEMQQRMADFRVQAVIEKCKKAGVAAEGCTPTSYRAWESIVETAKKKECDLIVMASHGRKGIEALLIGSETQRVLAHSPVPVLVVK